MTSRVFKVSREGLVERRSTGQVLGQVTQGVNRRWKATPLGKDSLPDDYPSRGDAVMALTAWSAR